MTKRDDVSCISMISLSLACYMMCFFSAATLPSATLIALSTWQACAMLTSRTRPATQPSCWRLWLPFTPTATSKLSCSCCAQGTSTLEPARCALCCYLHFTAPWCLQNLQYSLWITFNSLTVTVLVFGSTCVFAGWSDSADARRESRTRGYGPGAVVLWSSGQHPWWRWLHCPHVCLWAWSCGHCSSATLCPRLWCDTHR